MSQFLNMTKWITNTDNGYQWILSLENATACLLPKCTDQELRVLIPNISMLYNWLY